MFYKEKGFYISLACGIVALAAFALICANLLGKNTEEGDAVAEETAAPTAVATATPASEETSGRSAVSTVEEPTPAPKKKTVETSSQSKKTLSFDQEAGLLWPVQGDVIMDYSADAVVYFKTLAQYRTNPALIIGAAENTEVKSAADGIVKSVTTSDETGRTVTVSIGDDFTVTYGQLKEVSVSKGDSVSAGQVIGKIAQPTKYYSEEGANLYFQVKEKEEPVNPMLLLN